MKRYTGQEAAMMLGVGLTTLDKLRNTGRLGYYQAVLGGKVQFTEKQLDAFLAGAERQPKRGYHTNGKK